MGTERKETLMLGGWNQVEIGITIDSTPFPEETKSADSNNESFFRFIQAFHIENRIFVKFCVDFQAIFTFMKV